MIIEATHKDIRRISRLWLAMVLEKRPEWEPNVEWWRTMAHEFLNMGHYTILMAYEGNKIVGFADYFIMPEPSTGKIHSIGQHLYIKPEFRKKWHGASLVREWRKRMKNHKVTIFEMFAFIDETKKMAKIRFYPY